MTVTVVTKTMTSRAQTMFMRARPLSQPAYFAASGTAPAGGTGREAAVAWPAPTRI